jgi:GTP cyclohydrolase I
MSSPTDRLSVDKVRCLTGGRPSRPTRSEAEAAFRTIIRWSGDDPDRDGLTETPARAARAFDEFFVGYLRDPAAMIRKTFDEIEGYDEMIVLRGIRFESHCEHHIWHRLPRPARAC